jgi:hypothetical protein
MTFRFDHSRKLPPEIRLKMNITATMAATNRTTNRALRCAFSTWMFFSAESFCIGHYLFSEKCPPKEKKSAGCRAGNSGVGSFRKQPAVSDRLSHITVFEFLKGEGLLQTIALQHGVEVDGV